MKKILISLGTSLTIAMPTIAVVACSDGKPKGENNDKQKVETFLAKKFNDAIPGTVMKEINDDGGLKRKIAEKIGDVNLTTKAIDVNPDISLEDYNNIVNDTTLNLNDNVKKMLKDILAINNNDPKLAASIILLIFYSMDPNAITFAENGLSSKTPEQISLMKKAINEGKVDYKSISQSIVNKLRNKAEGIKWNPFVTDMFYFDEDSKTFSDKDKTFIPTALMLMGGKESFKTILDAAGYKYGG